MGSSLLFRAFTKWFCLFWIHATAAFSLSQHHHGAFADLFPLLLFVYVSLKYHLIKCTPGWFKCKINTRWGLSMDGPVTGCFAIVMLITGWHRQPREPLFLVATRGFQTHYGYHTKQPCAKTLKTTRWPMFELYYQSDQIREDPTCRFRLQEHCVGDSSGLKLLLLLLLMNTECGSTEEETSETVLGNTELLCFYGNNRGGNLCWRCD